MSTMRSIPAEASTILMVDDEPMACKWFAYSFGDEFTVLTAGSVGQALEMLQLHHHEIAVLVTDFRMPERNGLDLLVSARRDHAHVIPLLVSAYAEKDLTIAAVNEGHVFHILEKPLEEKATRRSLRKALALYRQRAQSQLLHEGRAGAMRETLGFLAHELNTPLSTVLGYTSLLKERLQSSPRNTAEGTVMLKEHSKGQMLGVFNAVERSALHCQSLIATFVQTARDAYPGAVPQSVEASKLIEALLTEYPFESGERERITSRVENDFSLPGRRDLLYLVMCTLTKNALQALRNQSDGQVVVSAGIETPLETGRPWIRFEDNGPGISPTMLERLTKQPVSTRKGGMGMGLIFCRRVVQSFNGMLAIDSEGRGTRVTLYFQPLAEIDPMERSL